MIDYQEIIEELQDEKVMELLDSLDIPFKDNEKYILMPTVCHNEDENEASWKLYYYKDTHLFVCYTECGNMTIFNFLKHFYEARGFTYDWNRDILQVVLKCSAVGVTIVSDSYKSRRAEYIKSPLKQLPTFNPSVLATFVEYYAPEWIEDNISISAMQKFNIRYSIAQNKIIIPHYNVDGKLIGIRGRALNQEEVDLFGKYMPVQIEGKWYSHPLSLNLYGLNFTKVNVLKMKKVFLVEGEKSVLQAESFDLPNMCAAICGSHLNKFQIKLLKKLGDIEEVILCLDKDKHDFTNLYNICKKYNQYFKMSFLYDKKGLLDEKDSPTDKGEQIFYKLLNERIIVD